LETGHWYRAGRLPYGDEDAPHFITHVLTSVAPGPDDAAVAPIHQALADNDLLPSEHLVDAGYPDADSLVASQTQDIDLVGPVPTNQHWQQRAQEGFDIASFHVDWEAKVATCPQGQTSRTWSTTHDTRGNAIINIRFDRPACAACASRSQCTRSETGPRELTVRPKAQHQALQAARKRQHTPECKAAYAARAGIEGTLSEGVRVSDLRRSRYRGQAKTHLHHILSAAAINLRRFGAWVNDTPRSRTRTPAFVKLMARAA
jgi:transposase